MKIWNFINGWNWKVVLPGVSSMMALMTILSTAQAVDTADATVPDPAFLEFLGEGIQVGEELIDPLEYQEIEKMTGKLQTVKKEQEEEHE